ncbi:hypothetical protein [Pseudomonas sp. AN3A02]|uniref:hypothetical protein n=1 Tax=Pseudomonas sp. AN3A02 TaxID=2719587 RepID=UPI001431EB5C|nr:hypothetical protein [Pseudomonas sp. AN3A02]NIL16877.1 hypothetical protein [Pseudomonas sp. AN3A02]
MLAKVVNDDAGILNERGALRFFASKLAPTKKEAGREAATGWLQCGEAKAKSKAKAGTVQNVGAGLLAKVVNDDAGILNERGALRFFASKLAPTEKEAGREAATGRLECGEATAKSKAKAGTVQNVGAGLLAKVVNDDAGILDERGALRFFASKLAPTEKEAGR